MAKQIAEKGFIKSILTEIEKEAAKGHFNIQWPLLSDELKLGLEELGYTMYKDPTGQHQVISWNDPIEIIQKKDL